MNNSNLIAFTNTHRIYSTSFNWEFVFENISTGDKKTTYHPFIDSLEGLTILNKSPFYLGLFQEVDYNKDKFDCTIFFDYKEHKPSNTIYLTTDRIGLDNLCKDLSIVKCKASEATILITYGIKEPNCLTNWMQGRNIYYRCL